MACIAIDCRFATVPAGLGTYTRGVVPPLIAQLREHHIVLFVRSAEEDWLKELPQNVSICTVNAPHYSLTEQVLLPLRMKQLSVDLLYAPHFTVPLVSRVPFVATVHDLTLHKYPNNAGVLKRLGYRVVMKHAVTCAKEVIVVSQSTQTDVFNTYGRKGIIVTEGYDPMFTVVPTSDREAILSSYGLLGEYFLYVGGSNEHKNLQMLIDAHAQSATQLPLVLVTNGAGLAPLRYGADVTVLTDVPSRDLPALYSGAKCFVTASLYEGFCLPILEARACGTPIIAVDTSSVPEITGEHGLLVAPTMSSLAQAFSDPPIACSPPESRYSWESAAQDISAILKRTLHG